tara:strand:+ start:9331 stop:9726 length:396 start_codon:yes stop_codon:yes gene_type:complete
MTNIATAPTKIKRRALFSAIPALAMTATAATAFKMPDAPVHDPIPDWFEEWKTTRASADALDDECEEHEAALNDLEEKICNATPTTQAGAVAQLEYAMEDFGDYMMGNIWKDHDRKLFANLLGALKEGLVS